MAETGEKYTVARRAVIGQAAQDAAIRDVIREAIERAAGVTEVSVEHAESLTRVTIRTGRPGLLIGRRGSAADRLRTEMQEAVGHRVQLNLYEVPLPPEEPPDETIPPWDPRAWPGR
jgi:ribosomal protein S3